MVYLRQITTT